MFGIGPVCSDDCGQIGQGKRATYHKELLSEPSGQMPEKLETGDFERWSLKLALHFLNGLSSKERKRLNPLLLIPEELSLEFKERILRHIKPCYVSEIEYKGHQRMFSSGEYCFRQPVPCEHIVEAARSAQLIA